jgi:calcineurin-like phosphoesterase family protein
MNKELIYRWNSVVGPFDLVYHLGDFAFCRGDLKYIPYFLKKLNGSKILIKGNHDRTKNFPRGFPIFPDYTIQAGEDTIYLSHRPVEPENWPKGCNMQFSGHVHEKWSYSHFYKALNIGVDVNEFTPVRLDSAIEKYHTAYESMEAI